MAAGTAKPAPLACDSCRRRHLRCTGGHPCTRCTTGQLSCNYTASRRGLARNSRNSYFHMQPLLDQTLHVSLGTDSSSEVLRHTMTGFQDDAEVAGNGCAMLRDSEMANGDITSINSSPNIMTDGSLPIQDYGHLVDLFYANFWPAHPVLLPQADYSWQDCPHYLRRLICLIGLRYQTAMSPFAELSELVVHEILSQQADVEIRRVQALLMSAILLHADHQPSLAERCISEALQLAITLRLNQPALTHDPRGNAYSLVEQESIRRTYWELRIVDAYLAALHRRQKSLPGTIDAVPFLPGSFGDRTITHGRTLSEFRNRLFLDEDESVYSSYCYRIEAITILERLSQLGSPQASSADDVQAIDYALASWKHNLPPHLSELLDATGRVDQMLFQTHCFISISKILLHFPRSDLPATVPTTATITGAKEYARLAPATSQHTVKAITASNELSDLAAIPLPIEKHSPLFACAMILACIVQLAAASMQPYQSSNQASQQRRDRITLMFGMLKSLGTKWAVARNALKRLKPIASIVLVEHLSSDTIGGAESAPSSVDSGLGTMTDAEAVAWLDMFEPGQLVF